MAHHLPLPQSFTLPINKIGDTPLTPFTPMLGGAGFDQLYVSYGIIFMPFYPNANWHTPVVPTIGGVPLVNHHIDPTTAWPYLGPVEGELCVRLRRTGLQFDEAIIDIYDLDDVVDDDTYVFIRLATITSMTLDGNTVYLMQRHVFDNITYMPSWRWPAECFASVVSGDIGVYIQPFVVHDPYTGATQPTLDGATMGVNITDNWLPTSNSVAHDIYLDVEVDDSDEWVPTYASMDVKSAASMPTDTSTHKYFLLATIDPTDDPVSCVQVRWGNFIIDRDGQSGEPYVLSAAA